MLLPLICIHGLAFLKISYNENIKELDKGFADLRSTTAAKVKALARVIKEKKALEEDLQAAEDRLQLEVQADTAQAKIWAAKFVNQASIKMAKEAANAGTEKAECDVAKWERTMENLGEDEEEPVVAKVGEEGKSKDAGEEKAEKSEVGGERVMQA